MWEFAGVASFIAASGEEKACSSTILCMLLRSYCSHDGGLSCPDHTAHQKRISEPQPRDRHHIRKDVCVRVRHCRRKTGMLSNITTAWARDVTDLLMLQLARGLLPSGSARAREAGGADSPSLLRPPATCPSRITLRIHSSLQHTFGHNVRSHMILSGRCWA